jgi:hypothetical protein
MNANSVPEIGITHFARDRFKPELSSSHFDGTWDELVQIVRNNWQHRKQSPSNSQVFLIPVPAELLGRFYSPTMPVTESTPLKAEFKPRREGEEPFINISADPLQKVPAKSAEVIVYSHAVLAKDEANFAPAPADYYIVAVKAYTETEPEPMSPVTMARNLLGLPGGTRPEKPYTAEDFANAIIYWSRHV